MFPLFVRPTTFASPEPLGLICNDHVTKKQRSLGTRMSRLFLMRLGRRGEGGCGEGLVDVEKNTYFLEVDIGKKRILRKSTVQKKFTHVQWADKKTCLRCSQHELYFCIKRFCICTCVPGKRDSEHKDPSLSNGFFFKFTTLVVTNLGQGLRSLEAEWDIAPPIISSFFFAYFYDSLLIFILKANTISFVICTFLCRKLAGDKYWTKSISELVEINPVILPLTIFCGSIPPDPSR